MLQFAELCERIRATTKKTEKVALVADFLRAQKIDDAALAAVYLSARPFPAHEEATLNVGGALISRIVTELSPRSLNSSLNAAYRKFGDLGEAAGEMLRRRKGEQPGVVSLAEVNEAFRAVATARGQAAKADLLRSLLDRAAALGATYLIKIITGDLRIGLRESLVEEAIAKAYDEPYSAVRRANMLLGDISETVRLAAAHQLGNAKMRLFHPIGMMLASPVESAAEAFEYFTNAAVEDKFDGIRAQVHADGDQVRIFSRTLDDVTASFPELAAALMAIGEPVILDGEVLAWQDGRALPFSQLQQRLGRKAVSIEHMRDVPIAYMMFDVIYADGDLTIDLPWRERRKLLERIFANIVPRAELFAPPVRGGKADQAGLFDPPTPAETVALSEIVLSRAYSAGNADELDQLFDAAQARGNEGLMIKDVDSPYAPGRRGKSWLKLKRELATLDVVVTSVEWGNGKRANVLSDYTFAVRDGDRLVNVGKAYSGLTDAEIATMTEWFKQNTIADMGHFRTVEPKIVLEVAFNNVMESDRHESGYALRFPRIVRIRDDKPVNEIDTVERVKELFKLQDKTAA